MGHLFGQFNSSKLGGFIYKALYALVLAKALDFSFRICLSKYGLGTTYLVSAKIIIKNLLAAIVETNIMLLLKTCKNKSNIVKYDKFV